MTCHPEGVQMTRHPEGVWMTGADNILSMIVYINTTRDDVWMTLVLSVRKEDIKNHFR